MKAKCKSCGATCEGEYCFRHKPRKPLPKSRIPVKKQANDRKSSDLHEFFLKLWKKFPHCCENCGRWLGTEPRSYMFDHLLEKSKYPELKYEEENIMLVCLECHDNKTRGLITDLVRDKIEKVREKFGK
jgi:5-methylcytosine-specific restriction endonuclease McrA